MTGARHVLAAVLVGITLCATAADAYVLRRDSTGTPVRWLRGIEFAVAPDLDEVLGTSGAHRAIEEAIRAYEDEGLSIALRAAPSQGIGYEDGGTSNQSEILALQTWPFDERAIAVTVVTVNTRTHEVLDADIAFNVRHRRFGVLDAPEVPGCDATCDDVQNTLTHELGHALGLGHNPEREEAVMYPNALPGETHKRNISTDDRAGLAVLYDLPPRPAADDGGPALGCSASGAGWQGLLALLPILALRLRRGFGSARTARGPPLRRRRFKTARLWAALPLLTLSSVAASEAANVVFTAEILSVRTLPAAADQRLWTTEVELALRHCVQGACPDRATVLVPGGRRGELEQWVEDTAVPVRGALVAVTIPESTGAARPFARLLALDLSALPRVTPRAGSKSTPLSPLTPAPTR